MRVATSNCRRAIFRKVFLGRPTDHFNLIYDLLDALDVGDDFLRHLLVEIGTQATSKHKYPLVTLAKDRP